MGAALAHHGLLLAGGGVAASLDTLATTPRCCLSLTRLISTYSGPCVTVRNSTTTAETDIYFSGSSIDTAALATASGGATLTVKTLYDQTGNGFHATQTTAANQPRIVNAGTYDGKLVFDGSNDSLKITALTQGNAAAGIYGKYKMPNNTTVAIIAEQSTNYNSSAQSFVLYRDSTTTGEFDAAMRNTTGGADYRLQSYGVATNLMRQVTALYNRALTGAGEIAVWDSGVSKSVGGSYSTTEQTGVFSAYDVYIGARGGSSLFGNLDLITMVFYNADTASIRTSIEALVA